MRASILLLSTLAACAFGLESKMVHKSIIKRQAPAPSSVITDPEILSFALFLEYLEADFYALGLAKFSTASFKSAGYPTSVRKNLVQLGAEEKDHVQFLSSALGASATSPCKYLFDPALETIESFLATARILENVGTSAYLGAAPALSSKAFLAAAGSILTVEARHAAFLQALTKVSPFPTPYDAPLTLSQVYSLAAPFVVAGSCGKFADSLPKGLVLYPMLDIKTMNPRSNKKLGLHFPIPPSSPKATTQFYANFINGGQSLYAPINGTSGVTTIPATLKGITYIIVVNSPNSTSDATTIAGPGIAILE